MSFLINPFAFGAGGGGGGSLPVHAEQTTITGSIFGATVAWPTHLINDIALLIVQSRGAEAVTLSDAQGFVEVTDSPQFTGTDTRLTVFWCRATSTSMASPTIADAGDHIIHQMMTFRGCVTTGNPWDITGGDVKASASTTMTYPSVTTTVALCLIVLIGARDLDTGATWSGVPVNVNLANITERSDGGSASGFGGGLTVATGEMTAAGATGTSVATVTSSINAMIVIALMGP